MLYNFLCQLYKTGMWSNYHVRNILPECVENFQLTENFVYIKELISSFQFAKTSVS